MSIYFLDRRATIHHADSLELLHSLPDASVDAVITDPPYGTKIASWDQDTPAPEYLEHCLRVSRGPVVWFGTAAPTSMMLNFSRYSPQPERCLIWAPSFTGAKTSKNGMFYRFHLIWCWRLPQKQKGLECDVLRHRTSGRCWWNHPATKPLPLMRDLIRAFVPEGGSVLDPWLGSGSTLVAAVQLSRTGIGCEIDPKFCAVAARRIITENPPDCFEQQRESDLTPAPV